MIRVLPWLALRNLGREMRRSALTASAMALGLALLIVSRTLSDGAHDDWLDSGVRLGTGHVLIEATGYRESRSLDDRLEAESLSRIRSVLEAPDFRGHASVRLTTGGLASSTEGAVPVQIVGVEPDAELAFSRIGEEPVEGRYLEPGDRLHAFIGDQLRQRLGLRLDSRLVLTAQSASGEIAGQLVRVVGIFRTGVEELDQGIVHIPLETARSWLGAEGAATSVVVLLEDAERTPAAVEAAQDDLDGAGVSVLGWREAMPELDALIRVDDAGDWVFHLILFVIVALAILNAVFMSVLHRERELGLLHAVGLGGTRTGIVVFLEGLFLTAASGVVGVAVGYAVVWLFLRDGLDLSGLMQGEFALSGIVMDPVLTPSIKGSHLVQSLLLTVGIGVAASLYPAWVAAHLDPAEAVKGE